MVGRVTSPTRRDPWLDNAKMTLVTLVVLGHSLGLQSGTTADHWLYDFVYFWHIPAFVLITGYLSRSFVWDRKHFRSLALTVVLPYLIFEPALYYYRAALGQHEGGPLLLHPHWAMWYLPVIFFWRMATPILRRHWVWLPLAVVISLVGGLWSGQLFYLCRVLGLLPFFVLGLHLDQTRLAVLHRRFARPAAMAAMAAIFVLARFTDDWARTAFLFYDNSYAGLDWSPLAGMWIRFLVMCVGLVGTLSILALVPRREGWYSRMGSATLVVYLFHGFFVRTADWAGYTDWTAQHGAISLVVTTLGAITLALVLASPPVRTRLVWAVDPVGSWSRRRSRRAVLAPALAD